MKIKKHEKAAKKVENKKEPQIELGMVFAKPSKPEKLYFVCDVRPRTRCTGYGEHKEQIFSPTGTTEGQLGTDGLNTGFMVQGTSWFSLGEMTSAGYEVINTITPEQIREEMAKTTANEVKEKKVIKAPPVRKRAEGPTIAQTIMALLKEGKDTETILDTVLKTFNGASTSKACVSFYKSKMKKAGELPEAPVKKPVVKVIVKPVKKGKKK